jgi:predicted dienelactone hydrolase
MLIPLRLPAILASAALLMPSPAPAQPPSRPGVDAPELAALGPYAVGTTHQMLDLGSRPLLVADGAGLKAVPGTRRIGLRVWYPADPAKGAKPASYTHTMRLAASAPITFAIPALAVENATPHPGRYPLVVVSHGLGGWDTALSFLTENLASKGYIVAAIDHQDEPVLNLAGMLSSLGNVVYNRANDQRFAIRHLLAAAKTSAPGYAAHIDPAHVGLIGYSMGGFGAVATAGANYDTTTPAVGNLPDGLAGPTAAPDPVVADALDAVVLIAPWGAQTGERGFSPEGLAQIKAPVLMFDGDQDDVAMYADGIGWIFDRLTGTDRRLVVFRGARHGIAGNPQPPEVRQNPTALAYFVDNVWRWDRLSGVQTHFITAFLDANLKGDAAKQRYLDTPTVVAEDGTWPQTFGAPDLPVYAGDGQPNYWRGFQRRSAVGLEMRVKGKGE